MMNELSTEKTGTQLCPSPVAPQGHKGHTGTQQNKKRPSTFPNGPQRKTTQRDTRDTLFTPTSREDSRKWTIGKSTPQLLHGGVIKRACVPCVPHYGLIHRLVAHV